MSVIEIAPPLEDWFERHVFRAFAQQGISVTPNAKTLIVYAFQLQPLEGTRRIRLACEQVLSQMQAGLGPQGTFIANAVEVYLHLYPPTAVLNVNRAIRLLDQMYALNFGDFPCGETKGEGGSGGQTGSSGSQGGTRGTGSQFFQNDPATSRG